MKIVNWWAVIVAALAASIATFFGSHTVSASTQQTCSPSTICKLVITDIGNGYGDAFTVQDYLGNPMAGDSIFQFYSTNPVCADTPNNQCVAMLGGPPRNATGGHPVLSLWDGTKWQTLTADDIADMHERGM